MISTVPFPFERHNAIPSCSLTTDVRSRHTGSLFHPFSAPKVDQARPIPASPQGVRCQGPCPARRARRSSAPELKKGKPLFLAGVDVIKAGRQARAWAWVRFSDVLGPPL